MAKKVDTEGPAEIKLELTNGAVLLVRNALLQREWYANDLRAMYAAGKVLSEKIPEDLQEDTKALMEMTNSKEWMNKPRALTVTAKEKQAMRKAMEFLLKKGMMVITSHVLTLVDQLEIPVE